MMYSAEYYSDVELNLYNPAFCGLLLAVSIRDYQEKNDTGMHCSLPYLLLPIILNKSLADSLPHSIATPIASWATENEGLAIGLAESSKAFISIVDAGLAFLLSRGVAKLTEDGCFFIDDKLAKNTTLQKNEKTLSNAIRSAAFLGRWFASTSSVESIYAQLGVRP